MDLDKISIIRSVIAWEKIELHIRKIFKITLPESIKEEGLLELYQKYKDKILEMEIKDIENELINIYIKKLKEKPSLLRNLRSHLVNNNENDDEFMKQVEEAAQFFPEFEYMASMIKNYPEFKEFVKKMQKYTNKRIRKSDEDNDEEFNSDSNDSTDSMFI